MDGRTVGSLSCPDRCGVWFECRGECELGFEGLVCCEVIRL